MSINYRLSALAESFAQHLHELHEHIRRQIVISNDNYNSITDSHKRLQEFAIRDEVMIRVRPKMFPSGTLKKLHALHMGPYRVLRRFSSNGYELNMPRDLEINPVFNVEGLTLYRTPMAYSTIIPDESASTFRRPQPFPIQPLLPPPLRRPPTKEIILTDDTVSTTDGTYHRNLVCWRGQPDSDCTWLRAKEIMQLSPELLHDFHRHYSPKANFSKSERVDGNPLSLET